MRFFIVAQQDYSSRIGGSWGGVIFDTTGEVDDFLARGKARGKSWQVRVEDDDGKILTEPMDIDEWQAWKEKHNPI
ncbi:MAG: hypothetical protein OXB89_04245 [Anaerolineaceae bacterium]|nr:hypothetical protein [Anaerolineaceae bacterium]